MILHDACLGGTQVPVRLAPVQDSFDSSTLVIIGELVSLGRFYAFVYNHNFLSLVVSLFSWQSLAASNSSFLFAAINLRPPSVTVSTHTSASNAKDWLMACATLDYLSVLLAD